jgi:acyl-CoA reductase-like NAD-dependent aldehyde dehydrogenase
MSTAATTASLSTVNPSTGETISQYKIMDREQVNLSVKQARKAFTVLRSNSNNDNDGGKKNWYMKN